VYAGFAFIVSLIREVIKDMEDELGDRRYSCKTMPIVWGVIPTKIFVGVWMIVLIGLLSVILVYTLFQGWFLLAMFISIWLIYGLYTELRNLLRASVTKDYAIISRGIKFIMLSGICSMLLYYYYKG
jgi:4-hydroxybenzoate polyprenyltransferase